MLCCYLHALGKVSLLQLPMGEVLSQIGTWQEDCWQVTKMVLAQAVI